MRGFSPSRCSAAGWLAACLSTAALATLATLAGGCFDAQPPSGGACAPGNRCPDPLRCITGVCVASEDDVIGGDGGGSGGGDGGGSGDAGVPPPPLQCPAGYAEVLPGVCHRSFSGSVSWPEAEARCEVDGAHLVIPGSLEEARLLPAPAWIGISDRRTPRVYLTVTGRVPVFTYWSVEPDLSPFDCAHTNPVQRWDVGPCDFSFPFVCEYDGVKGDPAAY